jgi:2-octaprenyl-6-methoxyphenol hydroxylase
MNASFDCVVVGAGFVGAALGVGLAQLGLRVAVVEALTPRPPSLDDDPRGLALAQSSVALLTRLGLWSRIVDKVYAVQTVHVNQRGHFGALRLTHHDLRAPALGYVCPAPVLQQALSDAMTEIGATVHWSSRVLAVHPETDSNELLVDLAGVHAQWSTSLLIGADGLDSSVRRLIGIAVERHEYQQTATVANLDVEHPLPHTAFERFTSSGPLALLPLGGRRYAAVRVARADEAPALCALGAEAYLSALKERFGHRLGNFTNLGSRHQYPLVLQRAREVSRPRTILVGNAANAVHPNAAQGLNLGFRDVSALLAILATAQRNNTDVGQATITDAYAATRRSDHRLTVGLTDTLARAFGLDLWAVDALGAAAITVIDRIPLLKQALLRRVTGFSQLHAG